MDPDNGNQDILKNKLIRLSSPKAWQTGIDKYELRLIKVYKENENKIIVIVCNNLEWKAPTIADLQKKMGHKIIF